MSLLDYPEKTCPMCGGDLFWYSVIEPSYHGPSEWLCGSCRPPTTEGSLLVMRIMRGNVILTKARAEIKTIEDKEEKLAQFKLWGEALDKIGALGKTLKNISTDCLYIEKGKKLKSCIAPFDDRNWIECQTCPNDYWWERELFDKEQKMSKLPDSRPVIRPVPVEPKQELKNFMGEKML
jgi:hypothetical protein